MIRWKLPEAGSSSRLETAIGRMVLMEPSRSHQKPMCHFNLGNHMEKHIQDVQEQHTTNRKCRDSGVQFDRSNLLREMTVGVWWGSFPNYQRSLIASKRVCHTLPALIGEAGSELGLPFFRGT
ncbi:hypothetical protein J6590_035955 [Homalodisca vitripennis]|nr:hypothetical protein J6590_035955 [Homalodisca vitripennis]